MDEYINLIFFLVVLALLGLSRLTKWSRDQRDMARPRGERRAPVRRVGKSEGEVPGYSQVWKEARETMMPEPEVPETRPEDRKKQRADVRAEETPTEIRKAPGTGRSLFRDAADARRGVIWAEVLRRPGPRWLRGRRPFMRPGMR